jgi:hypothetical protein
MVVVWLHVLGPYLHKLHCLVVVYCTNNALPDDGVTALKHVGAVLM